MNPNWKKFLIAQGAVFEPDNQCVFADQNTDATENQIFALPDLAILHITGKDATSLLQGQSTCNINDLTNHLGSFGAFCTPKGRALCCFYVCKFGQGYLLILAAELLASISKRLQMYVLRSDVQIDSSQEHFNLIGLKGLDNKQIPLNNASFTVSQVDEGLVIRLPGLADRFLSIVPEKHSEAFWQTAVNDWHCVPTGSNIWQLMDIQSGIPWLNSANSDEYIPQMLNLDQLNGISFNKGCYTGQEIIARTHYKGKAKRQMYLVQTSLKSSPEDSVAIIDKAAEQQPVVGKTLLSQASGQPGLMLAVIQIDHAQSPELYLDNEPQEKITVSEFSY